MTVFALEQLLGDEQSRRREFPVCERKVFLAHAGVSPLPRRVSEAMRGYLEAAARDDQEEVAPQPLVGETRQLAGRLIGAGADEIAFVGSTSMGLAMVAAGLPWRSGDRVVCYRDDYPANVYPWMNLAARGVEVRFVQPRQPGRVTVEDLGRVVDGRTRLVSLASAHFLSGWRLDVEAVGKFLRERGILFCVDGIQTFGALRESMRFVDFAAADAHKWMLGPLGVGILYVRREHFERLRPVLVGWRSAPCPEYVAQERLQFWPDARRYEPGSFNVVGLVGLREALRMLLQVGIEQIEGRVLALARRVVEGARERGWSVVGPVEQPGLSGIVSIQGQDGEVERLFERLTAEGFVVSLRRWRDGRAVLRVSAHFYNTEAEVDGLVLRL
jgi:cysteine desulfurase/selenocysteine lyase